MNEVVDSRAARTNQALVIAAVVSAWWLQAPWAVIAVGVVLVAGAAAGTKYVLGYRVYFALVQPVIGAGRTEDARAPRFAQLLGGGGLIAGGALVLGGIATAGWITALGLAGAAASSVLIDFCVGCRSYQLLAKLRGRTALRVGRLDPRRIGFESSAGNVLVEFMHPICHACQTWKAKLEAGGDPYVIVDVREQPGLADEYGIVLVPTVLEVRADGTVVRQLAP